MKRSASSVLAGVAAILMLAAAPFVLSSCGDDDKPGGDITIWDILPYSIQMRVVDSDGLNLLDTKNANNVIKDSITVEYEGNVYKVDTAYNAGSRAVMPEFTGLTRYAPVGTRNYVLIFGEFDSEKNVSGKEIVIDWKDGSKKDTITFSHSCTWQNDEPNTSTTVMLNGKATTLPVVFTR